MRAERRAGEMLIEMAEHKERDPGGKGPRKVGSQPATQLPKLSDLGISKSQSSRWQKLARLKKDDFEDLQQHAVDAAFDGVRSAEQKASKKTSTKRKVKTSTKRKGVESNPDDPTGKALDACDYDWSNIKETDFSSPVKAYKAQAEHYRREATHLATAYPLRSTKIAPSSITGQSLAKNMDSREAAAFENVAAALAFQKCQPQEHHDQR
jgi:hypothetical protein